MSWTSRLFLFMGTALVQGQPQYEVQVRLPFSFRYRSEHKRLDNGSCCSFNETAALNCTTQCSEIQITLCFREAHHSLTDTDITNCPLGMITVTPGERGGLISLNATSNATTTTYPGSYHINYKIKASEGTIDQADDNQTDYIQDPSTFARLRGKRTSFETDHLAVVCKEGYFGPDCGCTPRDDSTRHFTCDENGTIVCLPGYQNTTTNCVEEFESITDPEIEIPTNLSTAPTSGVAIETSTDSPTVTVGKTTTVIPTPATNNVMVITVSVYESDGDIVPIVASGVAED